MFTFSLALTVKLTKKLSDIFNDNILKYISPWSESSQRTEVSGHVQAQVLTERYRDIFSLLSSRKILLPSYIEQIIERSIKLKRIKFQVTNIALKFHEWKKW